MDCHEVVPTSRNDELVRFHAKIIESSNDDSTVDFYAKPTANPQ